MLIGLSAGGPGRSERIWGAGAESGRADRRRRCSVARMVVPASSRSPRASARAGAGWPQP